MKRFVPLLLLVIACASTKPEPPAVPEWDAIPAGISAAFCQRLQMDGIGTIGTDVAIVKVTQPIASAGALAQLGKPRRPASIVHRAVPVATAAGACAWKPVDALDPNREHDLMVVELSAPVANPAARAGAGIVARVTLGGTHPSWYWIDLVPRGGGWTIGRIFPLSL